VGVTDGLGVHRTDTWNGSTCTAPDTSAGVATVDTAKAAVKATTYRSAQCSISTN
jgi:hypothetical protein